MPEQNQQNQQDKAQLQNGNHAEQDGQQDEQQHATEARAEATRAERLGKRPRSVQAPWIDEEHTEDLSSQNQTPTDQYEGNLEAGLVDADAPGSAESLELLNERELRADETNDAYIAAEEGLAYVPPIDPPIVPSNDYEAARVASGLSASALGEAYNEENPARYMADSDAMRARVREALRADSSTTAYVEQVQVDVEGDTVMLSGEVEDLVDSDNLSAVAQYVEGIDEVINNVRVRAIE
jgi:hypothetical protein